MSRRTERANALVRDEISRVLPLLNDPRLASLITITEVQTSGDLRRAKVFVSVLGDDAAKRDSLAAMNAAGGFIHRSIKRNLRTKYAPVLSFHIDDSIEKGAEMIALIEQNTAHLSPNDTP